VAIELREIDTVASAEPGQRCNDCSAPLAEDQRYCLNCGARTPGAGPRLAAVAPPSATPGAIAATERPRRWTDAPLTLGAAAAGIGLLLLVLIAGVLIGRSGDQNAKVAAAPPQVIRVAAPTSAATAAPATESFASDWPDGKKGFTVQLQTLANDSPVATVQSAKKAAGDKGAPGVGALNSDDFASLDSGQYVIYSGIYTKRPEAARALKKLKSNFPGARVIAVNDGGGGGGSAGGGKQKTVHKNQLKNLDKLSPQEYSKKSRKLPKTLKLPGKPPPKDNKKPGGGGGSETIG
jgi:hypothetical protein